MRVLRTKRKMEEKTTNYSGIVYAALHDRLPLFSGEYLLSFLLTNCLRIYSSFHVNRQKSLSKARIKKCSA
jgi:hypothetical protein